MIAQGFKENNAGHAGISLKRYLSSLNLCSQLVAVFLLGLYYS